MAGKRRFLYLVTVFSLLALPFAHRLRHWPKKGAISLQTPTATGYQTIPKPTAGATLPVVSPLLP